ILAIGRSKDSAAACRKGIEPAGGVDCRRGKRSPTGEGAAGGAWRATMSGRVALIVGGGNGVGRATALLAALRGAHVVVADRDPEAAKAVAAEAQKSAGKEAATFSAMDIRERESVRKSLRDAVS